MKGVLAGEQGQKAGVVQHSWLGNFGKRWLEETSDYKTLEWGWRGGSADKMLEVQT